MRNYKTSLNNWQIRTYSCQSQNKPQDGTGDYRRQWRKNLPLAVLNYNTTYHATLGCEQSRIFHGRIPCNILDHKLGLNPNPKVLPTTDFADEFQRRTRILLDSTKKKIMQSYLKYKEYYDRKAKAAPLKRNDYCFILQPIADHQGSKIRSENTGGLGLTLWKKICRMKTTLSKNFILIKRKFYNELDYVNTNPTLSYKTLDRKATYNRMTKLLYRKMTCTSSHGIPILENFPTEANTIPTCREALDTSNDYTSNARAPDEIFTDVDVTSSGPQQNDARAPDEFFTDVDLGSTGPHENDEFAPLEKTRSERTNDRIGDQQSSGGSDTIVPEVLDDENDEMIVENESPRGGKNNLRPNPTPNFTDEYRH